MEMRGATIESQGTSTAPRRRVLRRSPEAGETPSDASAIFPAGSGDGAAAGALTQPLCLSLLSL